MPMFGSGVFKIQLGILARAYIRAISRLGFSLRIPYSAESQVAQ